jgi:hypothetical protein
VAQADILNSSLGFSPQFPFLCENMKTKMKINRNFNEIQGFYGGESS